MKTLVRNTLFIIAMLFLVGTNAQTAVQYMDQIGKEFNKISEETWDYTRAIAHNKKGKQIENRRRDMLNANRQALNKIKNMPPFNGDGAYRDSTARYLELSYAVLNNDYSKIVDMEEIAEQSYDAMEAYMMAQEKANEKLEAAFDVASNSQKAFAAKNNIILHDADSKTEQKLEKASEVFKYYNKVYLLFFKPFKQEVYLIDAQNKGDINAVKQNQEALSKLAKEAKDKIKLVEAYNNNTTLKSACTEMMNFYIFEADEKIPALVDFFLKKEKFDKLKTAIDKKGQNASKQEIDEFNAAVNDYNKASNAFNNINNELNSKRSSALNNWNSTVSKYLDRNVSKKK